MLFSLDVVRARKGDSILLHYGSKDDPRLAIIDGGPKAVYAPHLKPRLEQIKRARGLGKNEPLVVDLLMVSHVDDDHIQGILDLTRDLIQDNPQFAQILGFWHNSFENIIGQVPQQLTASFKQQFGAASMNGEPPPDMTLDVDEDEVVVVSSLKVLASIQQGAQLRSDIKNKLKAELNADFDGGLVLAKEGGQAVELDEGVTFTVVGPMEAELKNLYAKHQEWLKDLDAGGQSAEDVLAAYVDKSVPNLSSIVVLAEAGGKRILLTGDARGDKILEGLEMTGLLEENGTIEIDVLKVPHHGSANNVDEDFYERIIARHYVFSGNGEHGNPDRESFEMLLRARGDGDYVIHLTYPVGELDAGRKLDWEKEQKKQRKKHEKNPKVKVRPDWSHEENSLQALFDAHPEFAAKVRFIEENEAHVIDLLEKVNADEPE
jgi:hypothetical protein